jgi:hypothetical protein
MFESGAVICLGLVMWFSRTSWRTRMWLLSHPLALDILTFVVLVLLHWGTFSGVMAATVGALMVSVMLTCGTQSIRPYREWQVHSRHVGYQRASQMKNEQLDTHTYEWHPVSRLVHPTTRSNRVATTEVNAHRLTVAIANISTLKKYSAKNELQRQMNPGAASFLILCISLPTT